MEGHDSHKVSSFVGLLSVIWIARNDTIFCGDRVSSLQISITIAIASTQHSRYVEILGKQLRFLHAHEQTQNTPLGFLWIDIGQKFTMIAPMTIQVDGPSEKRAVFFSMKRNDSPLFQRRTKDLLQLRLLCQ